MPLLLEIEFPSDAPLIYIVGFIAIAIALRIMAGKWDRKRIAKELKDSGCTLLHASWSQFGKGTFGETNTRTYEVSYLNSTGEKQYATVQTSLFNDVFWSGDGPPSNYAPPEAPNTKYPVPPSNPSQEEAEDCRKCGALVQTSQNFCPNCGQKANS